MSYFSDHTINPTIDYVCPIVLNLGEWPETVIVSNLSREIINATRYDNQTLAIIGQSISLVFHNEPLTTNSTFYYEIEKSQYVLIKICTTSKEAQLLGTINVINGPPISKNIIEVINQADNPPIITISAPESIETEFLRGKVWPLDFTTPEIVPHIEFQTTGNIQNITLYWLMQDGLQNTTLPNENGTFIFAYPVLLQDNSFLYPLDTYTATIYNITPELIQPKISNLSIRKDLPYTGIAKFENNQINFIIQRKNDSIWKYWIILIFTFIYFLIIVKSIKYLNKSSFKPKPLLKILECFGLILGNFLGSEEILSIGSIPYLAMLLILIFLFYKRKGKLTDNENTEDMQTNQQYV